MPLEKKPFRKYNEGPTKKDIISIRINDKERAELEQFKEMLNIHSDSKALKFSLIVARNVLHRVFGKDQLSYLFKKDRQKLEDYKNF